MDIYKLSEAHGRDAGIEVELQKVCSVFILWELVKIDLNSALEWRGRKEIAMFHSTPEVREKVGKVIQAYATSRSEVQA